LLKTDVTGNIIAAIVSFSLYIFKYGLEDYPNSWGLSIGWISDKLHNNTGLVHSVSIALLNWVILPVISEENIELFRLIFISYIDSIWTTITFNLFSSLGTTY
jgi:hypothetical protein